MNALAAAVTPIMKLLVATAAFIGTRMSMFIAGTLMKPPPTPRRPENRPAVALMPKPATAPTIAPRVVATSRNIASRRFVRWSRTYTDAAPHDVAMTPIRLVAIATLMSIPKARVMNGIRKTPPPIPRNEPAIPARNAARARSSSTSIGDMRRRLVERTINAFAAHPSPRQHDLDAAHTRRAALFRRDLLRRDAHIADARLRDEAAANDLRDIDRAGNRSAARLHDDVPRTPVEVGDDRKHVVHRRLLPDVDDAGLGHGSLPRGAIQAPRINPLRARVRKVLVSTLHRDGRAWQRTATPASTRRRA